MTLGPSVPEAFSVDEIGVMSDDAIVLAIPGLFRGAPDATVQEVDDHALCRAARALADLMVKPDPESILPAVLDERVVPAVAGAVAGLR